jgi:tetratricopeptide (TPR) repeat protein
MLAHHYLEALRLGRAAGREEPTELAGRARLAARDAGDHALALGSLPAAAHMYEAALELWPPGDEHRPELLLAYARARVDDVALDDAVLEGATEGLLRAGKIEAAAEAQARLGSIWVNRGDHDRALEHLEGARELVDGRGPSPAKAFVLQELARALMMADDFERAVELGSESLRLAETFDLEAARARNLNTLGVGRVCMGDRGGLEDLEQAVAIAAAVNSHEQASAAANLAWMTAVLGDLRRAGELLEQGRSLAHRLGAVSFIDWLQAEHAVHSYWQGRWDVALTTADDFIGRFEASSHYMEGGCRYVRAEIALARGGTETALAEARRATALGKAIRDPQALNPLLVFEARARLAAGDRAGANTLADEVVRAWQATSIRQPTEYVDAPWLFIELARAHQLEESLEHAVGRTPWHEAAQRVLSGDLVAGAELYAEIGSVPDEAYTRLRAAGELVRGGERAEADRQLRLALPVFAQLGATAWAAEGEALLAESA